MKAQDLMSRLTKAEETLAESQKEMNQLDGRLATLTDSLQKITGKGIKESQDILTKWKIELQEMEEAMGVLLEEIEKIMDGEDED